MSVKQTLLKNIDGPIRRGFELFFPKFSELQLFTILCIGAGTAVFAADAPDFFSLACVTLALCVGYFLLRKTSFSETAKIFLAVIFNGTLGLVALLALDSPFSEPENLPEKINNGIVAAMLFVTFIRGYIALVSLCSGQLRKDDSFTKNALVSSLADTQYRPRAFLLTVLLAVFTVYILQTYYAEPSVTVLLGFFYTNILFRISAKLLAKNSLIYK